MVDNDIILIGASSDLAKAFEDICYKNKITTLSISQNKNFKNSKNSLIIGDYENDYKKIEEKIKNLNNPIIIFFNGALFENRPFKNPSKEEEKLTKKINFEIPNFLFNNLQINITNINKFVFISSMASVKLRNKNYIYGQSKKDLENSVKKLSAVPYLIFRFGKINTKMSKGHKNPPFTMSANKASDLIFKKISKKGIIYPNIGLKIIAIILRLTPKKVVDLFKL